MRYRNLTMLIGLGLLCTSIVSWAESARFRVDVAMNGTTFFDFEEHPDPDRQGVPPNGSPFIIQGYIYKAHTFKKYGNTSGVNADGTAEFPERVIGAWICRGWHLQDGDAITGPVVATTQIFRFNAKKTGHTVVTDGIELADFGVPFKRAVIGGSGKFKSARGELVQVYVANDPIIDATDYLNASGGFNTSFLFKLNL